MRRALIVAMVAALVVALSACSSNVAARPASAPLPGTPDAAGYVVDPLTPTSSATYDRMKDTPTRLLTAPEAVGLISMPWKLIGISADRRSIRIVYAAGGGCEHHVGFVVRAPSDRVIVTALSSEDPHGGGCADLLGIGRARIELPIALTEGVDLEHTPIDPDWIVVGASL